MQWQKENGLPRQSAGLVVRNDREEFYVKHQIDRNVVILSGVQA